MKRLRGIVGLACATALLLPAARGQDVPVTPAAAPIEEPVHPATDPDAAVDAPPAAALSDSLRDLAAPIRVVLLLSVLIFLPAMLLTLTSYTRIIIVLSFVRRAIGAPELPPNPILIGLALFMTGAVMAPTFNAVNEAALRPWQQQEIGTLDALTAAGDELKTFMLRHTREEDLLLALDLARAERPATPLETPFLAAVPAFVLSELRAAFHMGFVIYLPFVLIDLVVASILLALGMFMLPPPMIAMPLKILLFVLVDGWSLLVQSLTASYAAA